jgi:hypothetical protein
MTKPTHNYTIVGKRATRYRYQIYKRCITTLVLYLIDFIKIRC